MEDGLVLAHASGWCELRQLIPLAPWRAAKQNVEQAIRLLDVLQPKIASGDRTVTRGFDILLHTLVVR